MIINIKKANEETKTSIRTKGEKISRMKVKMVNEINDRSKTKVVEKK